MSTNVENRVVQMQFNNAQFEKAVQVTLNTLDKLKQKLNFSNSQKSLEGLAASAKKVSFEGMATNLDYISGRFTNLGIVGVTALQNITNSAINAGKQLVASLTVDPISMGFQEYETQINAIQTILANTQSKGSTLEDVNSALDELNEYADRTIYNFTEMTKNIGTFTAAGVDLDTSVSAIKGIANLAAVSGSTSQQASNAMYQLSQALAAGRVSLMDWNSVVNAGMGGEIFQESLKETSRVLGTGVDEAIEKYGSFRESLTQGGWLTTEVLTQTLAKFTGDLTEDQLRSIGYSEEQIKGILELGQTANDAATKIKTFTQLFDTLKESAQSGWTQSWEIIIGDFEEAKELLTSVGDTLTGFITNMSNARNEVLQFWKDAGGRTAIIEGVVNLLKFIGPLVELVGAQFNRVFKFNIGQALVDVSNKFFDFTENLSISASTIYNIQKTALGFATALSWVGSAVKTVVSVLAGLALDNLLATFGFLVEFVLNLTGAIGDFIVGIQNFFSELSQMNTVKKIFGKTADAAETLYEGFQNARDGLFDFILGLESDVLSGAADLLGWIAQGVLTVVGAIDKVVVSVMDWVNAVKELPAFQKAIQSIQNGINKFKETITNLKKTVSDVFGNFGDNAVEVFSNFLELIGKVKDGVAEFIEKVLETEEAQKVIEGFRDAVEKSFENVKNAINGAKEFFEGFIDTVKSLNSVSFDEVSSNLGAFKDSASSTLSDIFNGGKSVSKSEGDGSGTSIFDSLSNLVYNATSTSGGLVTTAKNNITTLIKFFQQEFAGINFGDVIAAGAGGSMIAFMLSLSNAVNLVSGKLASFLGIGEAFTKIFTNVASVVSEIQKYVKAQTLAVHANSIMTIAQAIALLAASIGALTLVDQEKLKSSALTLGLLAGGLIALVTVMSVVQKQLSLGDTTKMGLTMVAMAGSLLIMTASLKVLDTIDAEGMVSKIVALLAMVTVFGAIAVAISKFSGGKSMGGILSMIAMAGSLVLLTGSLYVLSKIDAVGIAKGLMALLSAVTILSMLMLVTSKVKAGSAAGMLAASASLLILAKSMESIFSLDMSNLGQKITALITVVYTFAALMVATSFAGKNALKGGVGILAMSAAILVLTEAIKRLADLDAATISKASDAIKQLLEVFALLTISTMFAGNNAAKAGVGILAMSAAMLILSGSIVILSRIEPDKLDNAVNAIMKMELMFALIIASTYLAKDCEKTLITIGVIIAGLAAILLVASLIEPSRLQGATAAISALMLCMALLVASTSVAGKANAAMILMMLAVAELAGLIYLLAQLEVGRALEASASLSLLLVSFSASMLLLQFANPGAAITGVLGLIAVVAIIGVFVGAIGALAQQIPELEGFIASGIPILEKIGEAIGSFVGGIVKSYAETASSALPEIANNISSFMTNIQGFINGVRDVDQSVVDGAGRLALAIAAISGAEFINNVFGGGTDGMDKFAESTSKLAEGLNNFYNNVGDIDLEKASIAAEAIRKLSEVDALVTKEGGFMQGLFGSSGMGTFSSNLESLGEGLKKFADSTSGIEASGCQGAIDVANALGELNNNLPSTGGKLQELLGSQDLSLFAENLPKLGEALKAFSDATCEIDAGKSQGAIDMGNALSELNNSLPESGGKLQELLGSNDLSLFAENLPKLGEALKAFADATCEIDAGKSQGAIDIANAISALNNALPSTDGYLQELLGSQDLGLFATNLESIGKALKAFADSTNGIEAGKSQGAIDIAWALNAVNNALTLSDGLVQKAIGGQDLGNFAIGVAMLGRGLQLFAARTYGIQAEGCWDAVQVASALALINTALPLSGGIISGLLVGEQSLGNFASEIPALGYALRSFADTTAGMDVSGAFAAAQIAGQLSTVLNNLPSSGGLIGNAANFLAGGGIGDKVNVFKDSVRAIADALSYFSNAVSGLNLEAITLAVGAVYDIVHLVQQAGSIDPEVSANLVTTFENVVRAINRLSSIDAESVSSIVATVTSALNSLVAAIQSFYPVMNNLGVNLMLNLSVGILTGSATVVLAATSMCTQFGNSLDQGLTRAVNTANNNLQQNISKMLKMALDMIRSYNSSFEQAGRSLMQSLASGVSSGRDSVMSAVNYVVSSAANSLSGLAYSFRAAGYNCMAGFAQGLNSGRSLAITAAANAAASALDAANKKLEVNSPSKAFYRTGMYSNMGFANGLVRFSTLVEKAGETVGQTALDSVDRSATKIGRIMDGTFGSGSTFAPVVTADSLSVSGLNTLGSLNREMITNQMQNRSNTSGLPLSSDGKLLVYVANTDDLANKVYVDGAVVNDDDQMRTVTKDFLVELSRKADL